MIRPARPASTVCVLRDGPDGLEVLMVQRGLSARFMGGAWVFPGGIVDDLDAGDLAQRAVSGAGSEPDLAWVRAGLRELVEEVRIWITTDPLPSAPDRWLRDSEVYEAALEMGACLDGDRLGYFANWVTPTMIPIRFDTRFYAVEVAGRAEAIADPRELAGADWLTPEAALELAGSRDRVIPFPTMKILQQLAEFPTAASVVDHARNLNEVPAVISRGRVLPDGSIEVVLPWEPGYDELADSAPDPGAMSRAASAAAAQGYLGVAVDHEG